MMQTQYRDSYLCSLVIRRDKLRMWEREQTGKVPVEGDVLGWLLQVCSPDSHPAHMAQGAERGHGKPGTAEAVPGWAHIPGTMHRARCLRVTSGAYLCVFRLQS